VGSSVVCHGDPIKMMIDCVDKGKARWWRVFFFFEVGFLSRLWKIAFKGFLVSLLYSIIIIVSERGIVKYQ
jgi:hypothetical protein